MTLPAPNNGGSIVTLDQAERLRALVRSRSSANLDRSITNVEPSLPRSHARSIVITSGKGGVGGSNLALNLAIALGEFGKRVVLVDADLGLANLDILCGLTPSADLGDVLTGACSLSEALVDGPSGIKMIPGAHGMRGLPDVLGDGPSRLAAELADLESESDYVLIDGGSGVNSGIATIAGAAHEAIVVTTPEPTSIADAQAALGRLRRLANVELRLIVNQARSTLEGAETLERITSACLEFTNTKVEGLGHVRYDSKVAQAVRRRRPFLVTHPKTTASRDVCRIAARWLLEGRARDEGPRIQSRPGFFSALAARWALSRSLSE